MFAFVLILTEEGRGKGLKQFRKAVAGAMARLVRIQIATNSVITVSF